MVCRGDRRGKSDGAYFIFVAAVRWQVGAGKGGGWQNLV